MDFSLTAEQLELRRMLRDVSAEQCPSARLREVMASASGEDAELWKLVADLGLLGVAIPEEAGGTGGSFVDAAVVLEESGRGLWPVPLLGSLAAVSALAGSGPELLNAVAGGAWRGSLVVLDRATVTGDAITGEARHVIGAVGAEALVVAAPDGLFVAGPTRVSASPGLDPTRRLSTVGFDEAAADRIGDAAASRRAGDILRVALAMEAIGVAGWCLDTTVSYLKTREQFGRPIGSFQALAHRAADLAVELSAATSTAYYAAWVVDGSPEELAVVAPLAKAVCADAAYRIAAETIQMHGGIGFTWEHDAHLYFKRATALRALFGDSHRQRDLVAERAAIFSG